MLFTIVKSPGSVALAESTKNISKDGASIGRGGSNSWVLPDPERFMSSVHTQIIFKDNAYFAIDQSTNGTFYNDSVKEIGKGNEVELHDGDRLIIGDYEIEVSLLDEGNNEAVSAGPFSAAATSQSGDNSEGVVNTPIDIPLNQDQLIPAHNSPLSLGLSQKVSNHNPILEDEAVLDPLLAFNRTDDVDNHFTAATEGDSGDLMHHSMSFPEMIPDNWFDLPLPAEADNHFNDVPAADEFSEAQSDLMVADIVAIKPELKSRPRPARPQPKQEAADRNHLSEATVGIESGLAAEQSKQARVDVNASAGSGPTNSELIKALGLNPSDMDEQQISEIDAVIGEFTQIAVKGLMLILKSRSTLKNEFRMSVTTIQSAENNPLKFSPTLEDAMINMFVRKGKAYKDPVTAVKEGIEGIADHQFAVFAGMRSAFNYLLERFNPELLEAKFDKQKANSVLLSKKAKNWDLYGSFYEDLIKDRDDSFQYLFGDEFVQAYEQQMQQLKITRNNKN